MIAAFPVVANQIPEQVVSSAGSVIYVNPAIGNDNASGQAQSPLRTLTIALDRAMPNSTIVLSPGTYSVETGEVFPIQLKPTITVQGDPRDRGQSVIIRGGDVFLSRTFARQNVTILGANNATLTGVTVTNPNPQGYGLWTESSSPLVVANTFTGSSHDGASIVGNSAPVFRNNYFYQNGANGITIFGSSRPEIQENIFERTGFGVNIAQNATPRLVGNRITQNKDGIVIQGNAQPVLRNNVIDGNDRDGIVSIAQSRPDLGTSADPGNNTFLGNRQFDINARRSSQILPAFGNQLSARTIGRLDLSGIASTPVMPANVASSTVTARLSPIAINPSSRISRPLPRPNAPTAGGVEIPVPAPMTDSVPVPMTASVPVRRMARPAFPRPNAPSPIIPLGERTPFPVAQSRPIPIAQSRPMPTLQINAISTAPIPVQVPQAAPRRMTPSGILPVPRVTPPIGNTQGTSVRVWRGGSAGVSQAASLGFRFRVIVRADSDLEQSQVRSITPDAFSLRGRGVMQAGAFRDRTEADELLQVLVNQGLQASIEQI
ncbi:serine/threonine protein kinase [Leptolyngbya sp. NIES-2104]|nr:serine/threonine protein kinase [Leptolyngbya sp. NIES-2104]